MNLDRFQIRYKILTIVIKHNFLKFTISFLIMRNISIINFVIGYLIILAWNSNKPVYSSARILNCTGSIPKKLHVSLKQVPMI